jgi:TPR repeat protein
MKKVKTIRDVFCFIEDMFCFVRDKFYDVFRPVIKVFEVLFSVLSGVLGFVALPLLFLEGIQRISSSQLISGILCISIPLVILIVVVRSWLCDYRLRKRAEAGDVEAQYMLGQEYNFKYLEKDFSQEYFDKSMMWYRKAAVNGHVEAKTSLGILYLSRGTPEDNVEAVRLLREAAEQGNAKAQETLGDCYNEGNGVAKDRGEAERWWRKSADQRRKEAEHGSAYGYYEQLNLGNCYRKGSAEDKKEAVKWFRMAARGGNVYAQLALGECYSQGDGVPVDKTEAVKWYRKAAENGNEDACIKLGDCYIEGVGVEMNKEEGSKWYKKGREQLRFLLQLGKLNRKHGDCCYYGEGGEAEDKTKAVKFYRMAAEQGDAAAQLMLGYCYAEGVGVEKDKGAALEWYRKAALNKRADEFYVI